MIPIYRLGPEFEGYTLDRFAENLGALCHEHYREGRATAFALIVHSSTDPHVSRVLRDPDYWTALDRIAGNALSVFAIFDRTLPCPPGGMEARRRDASAFDRDTANLLSAHFGEAIKSPAILFFDASGGSVRDYIVAEVQIGTVEEAFVSLKELLTACAESVRDSTGRARPDANVAFAALKRAVVARRAANGLRILTTPILMVERFLRLLRVIP